MPREQHARQRRTGHRADLPGHRADRHRTRHQRGGHDVGRDGALRRADKGAYCAMQRGHREQQRQRQQRRHRSYRQCQCDQDIGQCAQHDDIASIEPVGQHARHGRKQDLRQELRQAK